MTQIQESPQIEVQDIVQKPGEIPDTLPTPEEIQDKNNFAAMNGVKAQIKESKSPEIPQPEEIVTTRTVSQNPILKMGVIGGGILLFIMLIGGVINGSMNALNLTTTKEIEPAKNSQEVLEEPEIKDETGETKTALALTSQNLEFKKIRDQKAQVEATPTATPTPVAVAPPPPPSPPPVQATRTVSTQPVPPPHRYTTPPPAPVPTPTVPPVSSTATQAKAPPVDPMQQWLAVSNIGHYGTSEPTDFTSLASDELENLEGIQGGSGNQLVDQQVSNQNLNLNPDHNGKRVLVGSRVEGSLETPIAWSRNTPQQENQNYLIRLTKPLQAFDSTEVLPVGSYIVARLNSSNESGYVQMHAVSALINTDGKTEEKSIPENSVLILGKNGNLLKAKSQKGSELGGSLMASVLSGVAKAAEIQNRPTSQSTINSIGVSTVTTSNDDKNLVAGFAEGSINEMVRRMQTANQQRLQQMQSETTVFVLESGTFVQLFVNQTILL
ncbi:MAG: TrbI/VirB10 family protein [Nostoc sp. LLA-1]|nr:TrbI/VirB10 family protein [Cyanocohniella sp. LLY]